MTAIHLSNSIGERMCGGVKGRAVYSGCSSDTILQHCGSTNLGLVSNIAI